jgi:hypothetical protein
MYLTEEEARGKWCPQVRFSNFNGEYPDAESAVNTYDRATQAKDFGCIASECMMFRHSGLTCKGEPMKDQYYCGLAGKP